MKYETEKAACKRVAGVFTASGGGVEGGRPLDAAGDPAPGAVLHGLVGANKAYGVSPLVCRQIGQWGSSFDAASLH